jgi:uncharacterized membrane protein YbhN (UPF0104 family)
MTKRNILTRSLLSVTLRVTVSLLLLFFIGIKYRFHLSSFASLWGPYFIIALLLITAHIGLKSLKWLVLSRQVSGANTFAGATLSYLRGCSLAIVTPSRTGEVARIVGMFGNPIHLACQTVVDKLVELLMVAFFALYGSYIYLSFREFCDLLIVLGAVLVACILLVQWSRKNVHSNVPKLLSQAIEGFRATSKASLSAVGFLTLATFTVYFVQAYLLLNARYVINLRDVLAIFPLVLLTNTIPITIGGLGIREGVAVSLLGHVGVSSTVAIDTSLALFIFDTVFPGILGAIVIPLLRKHLFSQNKISEGL